MYDKMVMDLSPRKLGSSQTYTVEGRLRRTSCCAAWQHGSLGSWLCSSEVSAPSMRCMPTPRVCADSRLPQRLRRASADQSRFPGPEAVRGSRGSADMLFLCWAREAGMLRARSGTSPRLSQTGQATPTPLNKVTTAVRMTMTMAASKMARSLLANPPPAQTTVMILIPRLPPRHCPLVIRLISYTVILLVNLLANQIVNPIVSRLVSPLVSRPVSRLVSLLILDYH